MQEEPRPLGGRLGDADGSSDGVRDPGEPLSPRGRGGGGLSTRLVGLRVLEEEMFWYSAPVRCVDVLVEGRSQFEEPAVLVAVGGRSVPPHESVGGARRVWPRLLASTRGAPRSPSGERIS